MNSDKSFCPRAVIFDMDGLMLDSEKPFIPLWTQVGKKYGYNITVEVVYRIVGINSEGSRAVMMNEYGADFPYDKIRDEVKFLLKQEIEQNGVQHKKGLVFLLDFLAAQKIPFAVASSSNKETVLRMLGKAGVLDRFSLIVAGDEIANGKPAPDIFLLAAEKLGVPVSACVGFEDSGPGLQALHSAGIRSVFIKDIVQPPEEVLATVWRCYEDLAQAVKLFEEFLPKNR